MRGRLLLLAVLCLFPFAPATAGSEDAPERLAIRGVTMASAGYRQASGGYGGPANREQLQVLAGMGANWVAYTAHVYMPDVRQPDLRWRRGRDEAMERAVADAHANGIQVLLKPHVWSNQFYRDGLWHGSVEMQSEADWEAFFKNYGDFIVAHAALAERIGADALCIGTELKATTHREADWRRLIARVREVYGGALTYSSAADSYEAVAFWDALDCVGITAYYALADRDSPDEATIRQGWRRVYDKLIPFAKKVGRPICFTELGYSVSASAAREPWSYEVRDEDEALQARLVAIALDEARRSGVIEGVLLWKWFTLSAADAERFERNDAFGLQWRPRALEAIERAWRPAAPE